MIDLPPMAWIKWVEKRIGVIGDFVAGGRVFTHPEMGYGELCCFGGRYGGLGGLTGAPRLPDG